jgi:hypothetical protein
LNVAGKLLNRTLNGINKLCIASNNRKSKASSVSRLKEAFHNSERLLLKLREDECRKEEKRINDLKGKQMLLLKKKAEKAKKETERLVLKELKEQEKLAEKKRKEDERAADKLKRDQTKVAEKEAKVAERERLAKEKELKKAAEAAAKKGHRKPKTVYTFLVGDLMKQGKTMKEVAEIWKTLGDEGKAKYVAMHEADILLCEEEKKAAIADGTFIPKPVTTPTKKSASKKPVQKNNLFTMFGKKPPAPAAATATPGGSSSSAGVASASSSSSSSVVPVQKLSKKEKRMLAAKAKAEALQATTEKIDQILIPMMKDTPMDFAALRKEWSIRLTRCGKERVARLSAQRWLKQKEQQQQQQMVDTSGDVVCIESASSPSTSSTSFMPSVSSSFSPTGTTTTSVAPRSKQLVQFDDTQRPPFWGVWSTKTVRDWSLNNNTVKCSLSGRNPFGKVKKIDYDYDSDDEWEGGEPGEVLNSEAEDDEEEEEAGGKEYATNDGWMCADDVVVFSDDEDYSDAEELEDQNGTD